MKMPPKEKIPEALSAIADDRIELKDNKADVYSSNRSKSYLVEWNNNEYSSNDNATFWQGYPGYPIIAILFVQNKLEYDKKLLDYFKNIDWKKTNTKFKNDYKKSLDFIIQELDEDTKNYIYNEIDKIYSKLETMDIVIKRSRLYPPS